MERRKNRREKEKVQGKNVIGRIEEIFTPPSFYTSKKQAFFPLFNLNFTTLKLPCSFIVTLYTGNRSLEDKMTSFSRTRGRKLKKSAQNQWFRRAWKWRNRRVIFFRFFVIFTGTHPSCWFCSDFFAYLGVIIASDALTGASAREIMACRWCRQADCCPGEKPK